MTNLQNQVQQRLDELVDSGAEVGLQAAAYKDGELVVDAVAGLADPATGRPVTSDTPFYSASTGKAASATFTVTGLPTGLPRDDASFTSRAPRPCVAFVK